MNENEDYARQFFSSHPELINACYIVSDKLTIFSYYINSSILTSADTAKDTENTALIITVENDKTLIADALLGVGTNIDAKVI
jgi:hypothetical protein